MGVHSIKIYFLLKQHGLQFNSVYLFRQVGNDRRSTFSLKAHIIQSFDIFKSWSDQMAIKWIYVKAAIILCQTCLDFIPFIIFTLNWIIYNSLILFLPDNFMYAEEVSFLASSGRFKEGVHSAPPKLIKIKVYHTSPGKGNVQLASLNKELFENLCDSSTLH